MPRHGMCRAARQAERSLADEVRAVFPSGPIDLDMPLATACPAIFAPSPADEVALIDASFKALAARRSGERLEELAEAAESLRRALMDQVDQA